MIFTVDSENRTRVCIRTVHGSIDYVLEILMNFLEKFYILCDRINDRTCDW